MGMTFDVDGRPTSQARYAAELRSTLQRWALWPGEARRALAAAWQEPGRTIEWQRAQAESIAAQAAEAAYAEAERTVAGFLGRYDFYRDQLARLSREANEGISWPRHAGLAALYQARLQTLAVAPALGQTVVGTIEGWLSEVGDDTTAKAALAVAATGELAKLAQGTAGSEPQQARGLLRKLHEPVAPTGPEVDEARAALNELRQLHPELVSAVSGLQRNFDADGYKLAILEHRRDADWAQRLFGERTYRLDAVPPAHVLPPSEETVVIG